MPEITDIFLVPEPPRATPDMSLFEATMIAEGVQEPEDEAQWIAAWQMLHDTRVAYQLQGWFGRTARDLIEQGIISE